MRRSFILLIVAFLSIAGFCQTRNGFRIQRFNTETGLPSNGIKGLQWDEGTGFLWIATEAGIVRYNGMEFKIYDRNDEPNITNERILFLIKNNAGTIYTADNPGNLFFVEKNKLQFLEKKPLVPGTSNNFISLTVSEALYHNNTDFSRHIFAVQYNQSLPLDDTATLVINGPKLYYYSLSSTRPALAFKDDITISHGFKCGEDIFLSDPQKNIFLFNRSSWDLTAVSVTGISATELRDGRFVWENGMGNPIFFSGRKAWLLSYTHNQINASLISSDIPADVLIRYAQFDAKRRILFIGTDSKGIIVIEQNRVLSLKPPEVSPNTRTSYYSQIELPQGNILTNEGHVLGPGQAAATIPVKGRFSPNTLLVGDSILLYAQPDAPGSPISNLRSYNYNTGITKTYHGIRENYQLVMTISGNNVYLARDSGIYQLKGDSMVQLYAYGNSKAGMVYDMKEISPGILAIANCNSLLRFHVKQRKLDTILGPGNHCFRTIWKYKDYVFFGSYGGGLFIYKDGVIKPLPLDKNKYLLFTHCFIKDDYDFCWISTNRGLFKASIPELVDVFEKNTSAVYYYYYGKNDGMDMTELNGGCLPCAVVKKDKTISFPTMDGLLWVNPENATPVLPRGEIYVDNISIDGKQVNPGSFHSLQLPAKTAEIIISLGIAAWGNKENLYIDYRLSEDDAWRPVDIERGMEIRFNNLQSGDYQLMVRKRNGFGANNYTYKTLPFHITIPWYKKWWFYLLVVLAVAGLLRLYLNLRTRQLILKQMKLEKQVAEKTRELQHKTEVLEKNDTIKTRLISIISHDIVTPLKFLTAGGKNLVEKRELMSEELQKETLREMINTSQELQLLSTNILNWIKYQNENRRMAREHFNVHESVNQVLGVLNSLAKQKNLVLRNEIAPQLAIYQYYEPLRILIYNLVSNAISFSDHGDIIIGSRPGNNETVLFVKDEGVGMTPEQIQNIMSDEFIVSSANIDNRKGNGLGYLIIKDLLKIMGASFSIQSEKGKGTIVSVHLYNESRIPTNTAST